MKDSYEFRMDDFNFDAIAKELGIEEAAPYPSEWQPYVDSIVHKDDVDRKSTRLNSSHLA